MAGKLVLDNNRGPVNILLKIRHVLTVGLWVVQVVCSLLVSH